MEVPCQDTLEKHRRGKGHIKKIVHIQEMEGQQDRQMVVERCKPTRTYMAIGEMDEMDQLRREKGALQVELKENMKEQPGEVIIQDVLGKEAR